MFGFELIDHCSYRLLLSRKDGAVIVFIACFCVEGIHWECLIKRC